MILDAIAAHLAAAGLGLTEGTNLFKSILPDSPDACVAIFETPGRASTKAFGTTIQFENARFQILARSSRESLVSGAYSTARSLADSIYVKLDGAGNLTLSGIKYLYIEALQTPFQLERDENHRAIICCNYETQKAVG